MLSPAELARYARQLVLPQVGEDGQARLARARVLVVGAGGLGAPASLYLAAAGVGEIGLVDPDEVELSNLHRQIAHGTASLGLPKVDSAAARLRDLNPHVAVRPVRARLDAANADALLRGWDVVVDGTDSFEARYVVNDACVRLGTPNAYGSVSRFVGQASVFATRDGPCYRCLFPEPPPPGSVPSCAEGGVLGALPGIIGSVQAVEALKLLLGVGEPLVGRLLVMDTLDMRVRTIEFARDPACVACGGGVGRRASGVVDSVCHPERGEGPAVHDTRHPTPDTPPDVSPTELAQRLERREPVTLLDVREPWEWNVARLDGATLVPLGTLERRAGELPRDAEIVVYCHHGVRSDAAARWLRAQGFARVRNLLGGIDRWSVEVDPNLPRY